MGVLMPERRHSSAGGIETVLRTALALTTVVLLSGCPDNREIASNFLLGLIPCLLVASVLCHVVSLCFGKHGHLKYLLYAALGAGLPAFVIGALTIGCYWSADPQGSVELFLGVMVAGLASVASLSLLIHRFVLPLPRRKQWLTMVLTSAACTGLATTSLVTNADWPLMALMYVGYMFMPTVVIFAVLCLTGRWYVYKQKQERIQPASAVARKS